MNRVQIYLRLSENGCLERNADRDAEDGWVSTNLSMDTRYGEERETLGYLIEKFAEVFVAQDPISELSALLPVETQRKIGNVIRYGLFGLDDPDEDMRWLHLVPCRLDASDSETKKLLDLVCRLPWIFLSGDDGRGPYFLAFQLQRPFYITIDAAPRAADENVRREVKMPPQPRMLLVVADPVGTETDRTFGRDHAAELMQALAPCYLHMGRDYRSNLKFVRSYAEFHAALLGGPNMVPFDPDIIYFFGHGYLDDVRGMCLEFEGAAAADSRGPPDPRSIADIGKLFTDVFRESRRRPVVWVNACFGASSPGLNALTAFSTMASCVVTSRTAAATTQSRDQALIGLPALAAGFAPPAAIWRALGHVDQTVLGARWATTVVSVQYELWSALDTEHRELDAESVGDFPMRLDRAAPLRMVEGWLAALTAERLLAFMWTGGVDDSVHLFKERVEDRLNEYFRDRRAHVRQIDLQAARPRVLPDEAATEQENVRQADAALHAQFLIAAYCGLDVPRDPSKVKRKTIDDIAKSLKRIVGGEGAVLFLGHGLGDPDPGTGELIRKYLDFWAGLMKVREIAALKLPIILGFVHSDESELTLRSSPNAELVKIALEPIGAGELRDHIDDYNAFYSFDPLQLQETAEELVKECQGRFRRIHMKLEAQLEEKFQSDEYYRDAISVGA